MMRGYWVAMLSDVTATCTDDTHADALDDLVLFFSDVFAGGDAIVKRRRCNALTAGGWRSRATSARVGPEAILLVASGTRYCDYNCASSRGAQ